MIDARRPTAHRRESLARNAVIPALWLIRTGAADSVVISLDGPLDLAASLRLDDILTDLIVGQGNLAVVVDVGDAGPLDPGALDVVLATAATVEQLGGALTLAGQDPEEAGAEAASRSRHPAGGNLVRSCPLRLA